MDTAAKISEIVSLRNKSIQPLLQEEERCASTIAILDQLQGDLSEYVRKHGQENITGENCATLLQNIPTIKREINNLQQKIAHCRRRFDRPTINIGFGGKRGQGKSFLLQKFSGLTNNEVPSGSGKTVTAVRSEIFNDARAYAEITFYNAQEFLREIIGPYCSQLNVPAPASLLNLPICKCPISRKWTNCRLPI